MPLQMLLSASVLYFVFSPRVREEDSFGKVIKKSHFLFVMHCMGMMNSKHL